MTKRSSLTDSCTISFFSLVPFLLIAFGLAWGILGLFIFLSDWMTSTFGLLTGQHPLFFLAVYAPAIAAFIVVIYSSGAGGLRRYLARLLLWRCSVAWYACVSVEWDSAECLVVYPVFCRLYCAQRYCNSIIQRLARQHSALRALPLPAHEPHMARRAALRHLHFRGRRSSGPLVQPENHVHKKRGCHRSYSPAESLVMPHNPARGIGTDSETSENDEQLY